VYEKIKFVKDINRSLISHVQTLHTDVR